jgi:hypothetical protein
VLRKHPVLNGVAAVAVVAGLLAGLPLWKVLVAAGAGWLIFVIGVTLLGGMARPIPEPPPAGELRKVKLTYRCSICGSEVRMTVSPTQDPEPPRHCLEDMDLVTPVDDL